MAKDTITVGMSELRRDPAKVFALARERHEPVQVLERGKCVGWVVADDESWELADPTPEELEELKRNLAMSEAKIEQGIPWEEAKRYLLARRAQRKR